MIVTKGMYDKEFKFNNNGKEEMILIKPLPTKYLKQLFRIVKVFSESSVEGTSEEETSQNIIKAFAESDVLPDLAQITTETVRKAYPELDNTVLDEFVQANMFKLLPFIIEVNFRK